MPLRSSRARSTRIESAAPTPILPQVNAWREMSWTTVTVELAGDAIVLLSTRSSADGASGAHVPPLGRRHHLLDDLLMDGMGRRQRRRRGETRDGFRKGPEQVSQQSRRRVQPLTGLLDEPAQPLFDHVLHFEREGAHRAHQARLARNDAEGSQVAGLQGA